MTERELSIPPLPDTLLIVDDVEMNRAILAEIFKDAYRIQEAENGREGLEKIRALGGRLCAVLLDVVMPEMDGLALLRILAAEGIPQRVPIFLITAETGDAVTREAYALGVMDLIYKPVVPYVVRRRVESVMELFRARERLGSQVERQKIEIAQQDKKIMSLSLGMVEALSTAIEFRSGESGSHVRRIHDITAFMLRKTPLGAGLSPFAIDQIALAAIMHDVGKIAIPDAILNKPGKLTAEEFEIMKTHTLQGGRLLERIPQMRAHEAFRYAYDIALHHHERWDGRGYPHGLKGDQISLPAQIVSLADVYDALVSKRVYKDAYSFEKALEIIREGGCGTFNPRLLEHFFAVEKQLRHLYKDAEKEGDGAL